MASREEKLASAKEFLGPRWALHPENHVRRCPQKTPEVAKTVDVTKTIAAYRRRAGLDLA